MVKEEMRETDFEAVDHAALVDIKSVSVDASLPDGERACDFLKRIKNPYCFKCGKSVVKLRFADGGAALRERLEQYLSSL